LGKYRRHRRSELSPRRAAFLDRDGVLNALVRDPHSDRFESPLEPDEVRLLPDAAAAVRQLAEAGFALVGASNQPAAAKGTIPVERLLQVQERVLELLVAEGVRFDGFYLCLHHPEGVVAELRGSCECRKPAPGMLLEAAADLDLELASSWMIGDTDADVGAGRAAGCRTALIEHPGSAHKRRGVPADLTAADLPHVVAAIISGRCY
jgi:D-glycero-D-manno-heptose 1,7-bisphosphate phosphatase